MSYLSSLSMKSHKYESRNAFKNMTWEDIINNVNPKDISSHIEKRGDPLNIKQTLALHFIVTLKKLQKKNPNLDVEEAKQKYIRNKKGIISPEVQSVIDEETRKIMHEYELENRLRKLNDQAPKPEPSMVTEYRIKNDLLPNAPTNTNTNTQTNRAKGGMRRRTKRNNYTSKKSKSRKSRKSRKRSKSKSKRRKSMKSRKTTNIKRSYRRK